MNWDKVSKHWSIRSWFSSEILKLVAKFAINPIISNEFFEFIWLLRYFWRSAFCPSQNSCKSLIIWKRSFDNLWFIPLLVRLRFMLCLIISWILEKKISLLGLDIKNSKVAFWIYLFSGSPSNIEARHFVILLRYEKSFSSSSQNNMRKILRPWSFSIKF